MHGNVCPCYTNNSTAFLFPYWMYRATYTSGTALKLSKSKLEKLPTPDCLAESRARAGLLSWADVGLPRQHSRDQSQSHCSDIARSASQQTKVINPTNRDLTSEMSLQISKSSKVVRANGRAACEKMRDKHRSQSQDTCTAMNKTTSSLYMAGV